MKTESVIQTIWGLCHILRGDGISYHQYVSELTYLLFLKLAEENGSETLLPANCRWRNLVEYTGKDLLGYYQILLTNLGTKGSTETIRAIYSFPTTVFSHSENLKAVIDGIAAIEWHTLNSDRIGDIYEGLVEKSSQDVRSGAGQYFTPRALVNCIVNVVKPSLGDIIQDPASGTGGFMISADQWIRSNHSEAEYLANPPSYIGAEIEKNTRRICLMNTHLNGLDAKITHGDALTDDFNTIEADVVLANPPFGVKGGSKRELRGDIRFPNTSKQLGFLQHIYQSLAQNGRAAVVLPDSVLFDEGAGKKVRQHLMDNFSLHTILRLPIGIFYSAGVKTNVLFFCRGAEKKSPTKDVWIYDLRSNMPRFSRAKPIHENHFHDFILQFGHDPNGTSSRTEKSSADRFRRYSREKIRKNGDNLDISWLSNSEESDINPERSVEETISLLSTTLEEALSSIRALNDELTDYKLAPEKPKDG